MEDKVQAARVQGKYSIKVAVITGVCLIIATALPLLWSLISVEKENAELKEKIESLIAVSKDFSEKSQENSENYIYIQTNDSSANQDNNDTTESWKDFIGLLDPYETSYESGERVIRIMGKEYQQGLLLSGGPKGLVYYNLEGKYNSLEFDFGHIDGSYLDDVTFKIYLDDEDYYIQQIDGTSNMIITHYVIQLNNAKRLMITWDTYYGPDYGIVNAKIR